MVFYKTFQIGAPAILHAFHIPWMRIMATETKAKVKDDITLMQQKLQSIDVFKDTFVSLGKRYEELDNSMSAFVEEMLHKVMSSHKWDNYAVTFYFNQIVDKPAKPNPIPEDWKIFVGIASYRDNLLLQTMKSLISEASYPERLRIVVYNQ